MHTMKATTRDTAQAKIRPALVRVEEDQDADNRQLQKGAQAASPQLRGTSVQSDRSVVERRARHGRD